LSNRGNNKDELVLSKCRNINDMQDIISKVKL
jgi:hypothetical protein